MAHNSYSNRSSAKRNLIDTLKRNGYRFHHTSYDGPCYHNSNGDSVIVYDEERGRTLGEVMPAVSHLQVYCVKDFDDVVRIIKDAETAYLFNHSTALTDADRAWLDYQARLEDRLADEEAKAFEALEARYSL